MDLSMVLLYLGELENHNDRDWYHANKDQFRAANANFEDLLQCLILEIGQTDDSVLHNNPSELTFKLVRDTRFSNDKSPYNPAFRAHISSAGKLPIPVGYFIYIKPGNRSFIGGGLFTDIFKDATTMVRNYIVDHSDEWQEIISDKSFSEMFEVKGESLKKVPRGYDENHPQAQFLKNKSWYLEYSVTDNEIINAKEFINLASRIYNKMQPFNAFLNKALEGFEMPSR